MVAWVYLYYKNHLNAKVNLPYMDPMGYIILMYSVGGH